MRLHELNNSSNTIYFMMVHSNPPTYGYQLAFDKLKEIAGDSPHMVFINPMHDPEVSPLDFKTVLKYNKALFPSVNFHGTDSIKTPLDALKYLANEYDVVYLVTKDENVKNYQRYKSYADGWGVYDFEVLGLGDSKDAEATSGRTNTLSRQYVLDNDYKAFKSTIPTSDEKILSKLFIDLRKSMLINNKKEKDTSQDELEEAVEQVVDFIQQKSDGFSILREYFNKDENGDYYIMLETINKYLKNIKLVVSDKYKDYTIGKDRQNNCIVFMNGRLCDLNKKAVRESHILEKTISSAKALTETTAGSIATANSVLGTPIKRVNNNISYEFVKEIKYDNECRDKLQKCMGEFINRNGYINSAAINKIKEMLK